MRTSIYTFDGVVLQYLQHPRKYGSLVNIFIARTLKVKYCNDEGQLTYFILVYIR